MWLLSVFCIILAVNSSFAKETNRESEGYPVGLLANCPGSNKTTIATPKTLRRLQFMLLHHPNALVAFFNKTAYNYYQMKALASKMDFSKKTVLKVVGYVDSNYLTPVGSVMGSVYKGLGYNVLLLEYNEFNTHIYPKAARFLRLVGKHAGEMLGELTKYGLDPKKLELIGISHGGQAIGFIGKSFQKVTGKNISRITALDPGGPCFRHNGPEDRIDASDADFVDIIHTNIDGYGMSGAVGHIDYYVNGGEYQPGDFMSIPCTSLCSHSRAYTLWLGALYNPNSLIAVQCDSVQDARDGNCFDKTPIVTNLLGLNVDRSKQGIFYLMTHNIFPYAMGKKGLKKKNDAIMKKIIEFNEEDMIKL